MVMHANVAGAQSSNSEEISIEKTVSWINTILKEQGIDGGVFLGQISRAEAAMRCDYSVEISTSGALKIHFNELPLDKDRKFLSPNPDPARFANVSDWTSCSEDQIVISTYRETRMGKIIARKGDVDPTGELSHKVLAIRRDDSKELLVPLPDDGVLQEKLLKAFRHLVKMSKKEDPF